MPKSYRAGIIALLVLILVVFRWLNPPKQPVLPSGDYFGQTVPDSLPSVFAPGFISRQFSERDAAFTPDGQEFYFTLWAGEFGAIVFSRKTTKRWSAPQVVEFSGVYSDLEPFITADGRYLFFSSNRPESSNDNSKDYNIWRAERNATGWGDPLPVKEVNSGNDEFYPTVSADGTLYFSAQRQESFGGEDIYSSELQSGRYLPPQNVGPNVNSEFGEFNALIAPDERFLLFSSFGREDALGGGDIYISFQVNAEWTPAQILAAPINSQALDYCPALTPDGQYLLFTSRRSMFPVSKDSSWSYSELVQQLSSFGNGNDDIYWVSSSFIKGMFLR